MRRGAWLTSDAGCPGTDRQVHRRRSAAPHRLTVRDAARSYRAVCSASLTNYGVAAAFNLRSSVSQFGTTTRLVPADADWIIRNRVPSFEISKSIS